jgi:hypothetical protein
VADALEHLSEWLESIQTEVSKALTDPEFSSLQELTSAAGNLAGQLGKIKTMVSAVAIGRKPTISGQDQVSAHSFYIVGIFVT